MNGTWECRICRSGDLLVDEHTFCPNCSHERDWEEEIEAFFTLEAQSIHRFHGSESTCCDQGWSSTARYCGRCGAGLVPTPVTPIEPVSTETPAPVGSADRAFASQTRHPTSPPDDLPRFERAPAPPSVVPWHEPEPQESPNRLDTPIAPERVSSGGLAEVWARAQELLASAWSR